MRTEDFIIDLFCRVDQKMAGIDKHPQATLYPSELVTIALLFAFKGGGGRAFYRWLRRDWLCLFPGLPDRTRLFRRFAAHADWTGRFMADATLLGVADTYGIELVHPAREAREVGRFARKGKSNRRWIIGGKLGLVLNKWGLVCAWDASTANVSDIHFRPMVQAFEGRMVVLTDNGFHGTTGDPPNMKVCKPRTWDVRMVVETVLSMLTVVSHFKRIGHRVWRYFVARLAYTMAAFNVLAEWHGLPPDDNGFVHLSIAQFSL
jgi:hypothetical protein